MEAKEKLVQELRRRIQYVLNDCETFRRVREEHPEWFGQNEGSMDKPGLGAGNFMMAQALASSLNVLAKALAYLDESKREKWFCTSEDKKKVDRAVKALVKHQAAAGVRSDEPTPAQIAELALEERTKWRPPRVGICVNETEAFRFLVKEFGQELPRLGLTEQNATEAWSSFRNKLAHLAAPSGIVESGRRDREEIAFRQEGSNWICNVDALARDVQAILNAVVARIESTDEPAVIATWDWLEGQEAGTFVAVLPGTKCSSSSAPISSMAFSFSTSSSDKLP